MLAARLVRSMKFATATQGALRQNVNGEIERLSGSLPLNLEDGRWWKFHLLHLLLAHCICCAHEARLVLFHSTHGSRQRWYTHAAYTVDLGQERLTSLTQLITTRQGEAYLRVGVLVLMVRLREDRVELLVPCRRALQPLKLFPELRQQLALLIGYMSHRVQLFLQFMHLLVVGCLELLAGLRSIIGHSDAPRQLLHGPRIAHNGTVGVLYAWHGLIKHVAKMILNFNF